MPSEQAVALPLRIARFRHRRHLRELNLKGNGFALC